MNKKRKIFVQKFGGTSVESPEKILKIAKYVKKYYYDCGYKIIIVVSAMGKETDRLLRLAKEISTNPNSREVDQLLHTGEDLTAALMSMALNDINAPAISLTASQVGIVSSGEYGQAKIKKIKNKEYIFNLLKSKILVVAGFQGVVDGSNDIATLGRGGSDATAVALSVFMGADICEIYTDVDGIYCVDPRIVSNAKRLREISYEQMYIMAAAGAGVLFDRSVKMAEAHNVSLRVLLSPSKGKSDGGTKITNFVKLENLEKIIYTRGLAVKKNLASFDFLNVKNNPGEASRITNCFKDVNIIDFTQTQGESTARISILVESNDVCKVANKLDKLVDIQSILKNDLVALTLVDPLMREGSGYAYNLLSALGVASVNIEMITSSQQSISVIVNKNFLKRSCLAIAERFDLLNK